MFESTMIRAQKSLIEQLQKEIRKLEEEVKIKEQAKNELEKTIKNKEKLMEFQKANDKEFIENSKSVDDNLSFIQKQIELVPVIETKERVLDEKSSFIVNF